MRILAVNCGSATVKYALFETGREALEEILREVRRFDREETFRATLDAIRDLARAQQVEAVVYRVVHGGDLQGPIEIGPEVLATIERMAAYARLHHTWILQAIRHLKAHLPGVRHYAVFDTDFHQDLPPPARTYPLPESLRREGIRRWGFHGIAYACVLETVSEILGKPREALSGVILHLGSGASACAVHQGRSYATSMGLTPLEGLVMTTRCGDLDPGILLHLQRKGLSADEIEDLLNHHCGLQALGGTRDFQQLVARVEGGEMDKESRLKDPEAGARGRGEETEGGQGETETFKKKTDSGKEVASGEEAADSGKGAGSDATKAALALEVFLWSVKKYLGAYLVILPQVSFVAFSGGVGEHSPWIRKRVCEGLEKFGVVLDETRNQASATVISRPESRFPVLVIPVDEERQMVKILFSYPLHVSE